MANEDYLKENDDLLDDLYADTVKKFKCNNIINLSYIHIVYYLGYLLQILTTFWTSQSDNGFHLARYIFCSF